MVMGLMRAHFPSSTKDAIEHKPGQYLLFYARINLRLGSWEYVACWWHSSCEKIPFQWPLFFSEGVLNSSERGIRSGSRPCGVKRYNRLLHDLAF